MELISALKAFGYEVADSAPMSWLQEMTTRICGAPARVVAKSEVTSLRVCKSEFWGDLPIKDIGLHAWTSVITLCSAMAQPS